MQDLGALPGGGYAQAYAVNALGVIVGTSEVASAPFHAFVYRDGAMRDLNGLIAPAPGWTLEIAWDVSDSGLIVGWGRLNGQQRSFVLTPVPEPSSLTLLATAAATALVRRRSSTRMRHALG
jgi:probable HAF family extracellular repeat protein